ncbi:MAG: drug/metabolite transporter (DMT)-like permease [Lentimonas sp.]
MIVSKRLLPFAVLFCALLWGSAFSGIKAIYAIWAENGIEPTFYNRLLVAGVRFAIAGLALLLLSKQPWKDWKRTPKSRILGFALSQTFFQYLIFYTALAVSSATLGSLLTATGSLWWVILAPLMLKSAWPQRKQWLLLAFGVVGVLLAVYRPGAGSGAPVLGAVLFVLASLSGTLGVITLQGIVPTMSSLAATGFSLLIGGLMLCVAGIPAWSTFAELFTPEVLLLTGYLTFVSAAGFGIWNYLTTLFPVNLLAGYRFMIPICAVIESSLFVAGESPGIGILIGGVLVIFAVVGLQRTHR